MQAETVQAFRRRFDGEPKVVVRAPGRINLMGDHTDYNQGFVLPMAINRSVWIAARPIPQHHIDVYAADYNETACISLIDFSRKESSWKSYIQGVAWAAHERGMEMPGWQGVVLSDLPIGAGLSSSAALETAVLSVDLVMAGIHMDPKEMAKIGQYAENRWVGMKCGIMDQLASCCGQKDHVLFIDCQSMEIQAVKMPTEIDVVIIDTRIKRELASSAYNVRREACRSAAEKCGVDSLRDMDVKRLDQCARSLDSLLRKRARHVVTENERTLEMVNALRDYNVEQIKSLMAASHASLRHDFEVSCDELDHVVSCAENIQGCFGARMTGAGFGGCAVALVHRGTVDRLTQELLACSRQQSFPIPEMYVCRAEQGAEIVLHRGAV